MKSKTPSPKILDSSNPRRALRAELFADLLDRSEDAQKIARGDFGERRFAKSAPKQLGEEGRKAGDAFKAERLRAAEEIRTDADVIDARGLDQVDDVVDELRQTRPRRRTFLCLHRGERLLGIDAGRRLAVPVAGSSEIVAQSLRDEARHESRHDDPAIVLQSREHVVRRIARMIAEREGVGMRQRDRLLADVEDLAHRLMRDMGAVDHHAEAIKLADDRAAESAEAVRARRIRRRIDPREALVVAKRHQPRAGGLPDPQGAERIFQADAAFYGDERGDLAGAFR